MRRISKYTIDQTRLRNITIVYTIEHAEEHIWSSHMVSTLRPFRTTGLHRLVFPICRISSQDSQHTPFSAILVYSNPDVFAFAFWLG